MSDQLDKEILKNCFKNQKFLPLLSRDNLWYLLTKANYASEKKIGNNNFINMILHNLSFVERKYTLFFDNSFHNLTNLYMSKYIIPIKVESTINFSRMCKIESFNRYQKNTNIFPIFNGMKNYLNSLPEKSRNFGWFLWLRNKNICPYDKFSGLKQYHFILCENGIKNGYVKNLIFDWDRTLTVFEGIISYKNSSLNEIKNLISKRGKEYSYLSKKEGIKNFIPPKNLNMKDIAILYFGYNFINGNYKRLWNLAKQYDVNIYVLTANPAASVKSKNKKIFFNLLKELGLKLPKNRLICTKDYNYNKQYIIKNFLKLLF